MLFEKGGGTSSKGPLRTGGVATSLEEKGRDVAKQGLQRIRGAWWGIFSGERGFGGNSDTKGKKENS